MSLRVVATISAKAGSEDVVRHALTALTAGSRTEEGCLSYELFESVAAPGTFVTVEEWRDKADLDDHMGTPHVATALGALGDALAAPPVIHPLTPVA